MTLRLLRESDAQREWSGQMLVVREDRDLLYDIRLFGLFTLCLLLVTYPLWRPASLPFMLWGLLVVVALYLGYRGYTMWRDVRAARRDAAWLLAASRQRVWLHLRSYLHYDWPQDHETVIAIDNDDIESIYAVRAPRSEAWQLAIRLGQPLPPAIAAVLLDENTRIERGRFGYTRHAHAPVRLEENGKVVRVMFGNQQPGLVQALDKLRLSFTVDPVRTIPDDEAYLLPNRVELTEIVLAEAKQLVAAGRPAEAVKYLHLRTGLPRRDCASIVDELHAAAG